MDFKFLHEIPLLRIILPAIAGIFCAVFFPGIFSVSVLILITTVTLLLVGYFYKASKYSTRHRFGLALHFFFFFGFWLYTQTFYFNSTKELPQGSAIYFGRISEPLQEKPKTIKAKIHLSAYQLSATNVNINTDVFIYFSKNGSSQKLNYGDEIVFEGRLDPVRGPSNPYEFDLKTFYKRKGIYYTGFIHGNDFKVIGNNSNFLISAAIRCRDHFLNLLSAGLSGRQYAVCSALILGYDDEVDRTTLQEYSASGALHVLSVSGLHVGIIYLLFNFLLKFMDRRMGMKVVKSIVLIMLVWFYAAISGLSPSVLRSAAMISFVIVGNSFNRSTNIYNILAASALCLLVVNPYTLMEVGFQLSYLAVIGIVFIHPILYSKLAVDNYFLEKIWAITSVSIAAQLATLPVTLFYFDQFPLYFLLGNLLIIPLASLVLYSGIAVFALSFSDTATTLLLSIIEFEVKTLNTIVTFIASLPEAVIRQFNFHAFEMCLMYSAIILSGIMLKYRWVKPLRLTLFLLLLVVCSASLSKYHQLSKQEFVVLSCKEPSILFNSEATVFNFGAINKDSRTYIEKESHQSMRFSLGSVDLKSSDLTVKGQLFEFCGCSVLYLTGPYLKDTPNNVDYLVVGQNAPFDLDYLKKLKCTQVIADASNSAHYQANAKKLCNAAGVKFYSVSKSGAYFEKFTN